MHVISVQLGLGRTLSLDSRKVETGIYKSPVDEITLQPGGVDGDAVINTKHHGGPDQAVYAYSNTDYTWWEQQLGRPLEPGTFGENLTISDAPKAIRVGDRLRIGPTLLEVTAPRIPCATFAARMGEPGWIRRFRDAERPGFYCRVLEPGTIGPGDQVEWNPAPPENVSLTEMVEDVYASDLPLSRVRRALASPIGERARLAYQSRLG
jgi:MOSC domain-containing protein YiiM